MKPLYAGLIITDTETLASCFPCSWQFISSGCHSFPSCFICLGMHLGNDLCWWRFWSNQGSCTTVVCYRNFQILIICLSTVPESFLRVLLLRTERPWEQHPWWSSYTLMTVHWKTEFSVRIFPFFHRGITLPLSFRRVILLVFTARILNTIQSKNLAGFCILQPELMRNWNLKI